MKILLITPFVFVTGLATADCGPEAVFNLLEKESKLSGTMSLLIGGKSYSKTFGPHKSDMKYLIASCSKQFVGAAILRLEEQGRLKTSDPIKKYFPQIPSKDLVGETGQPITIEDIAKHISGIRDDVIASKINPKGKEVTFEDIVSAIKESPPPVGTPGKKWQYSNLDYILLGQIIKRASGMTEAEYMRRNLFEPAGLKDTTVGPPRDRSRVAPTDEAKKIPYHFDSELWADGNIYSTAPDMVKWLKALHDGRVLSDSSLGKLLSPSQLKPYGYGWMLDSDGSYYHGGEFAGYGSLVGGLPQSGTYYAFLGDRSLTPKEENEIREAVTNGVRCSPERAAEPDIPGRGLDR